MRWELLALIMLTFSMFLYPSLQNTDYTYSLGDVAEKDIKAPQSFSIVDKDATLEKQNEIVDQVRTVYDHDVTMADKIKSQVQTAFGELRRVIETYNKMQVHSTEAIQAMMGKMNIPEGDDVPLSDIIWAKKEDFENALDLDVNKGAYANLVKEEFSKDISDIIIRIVEEILENGVVPNKDVLLKEQYKGVILRNVHTKEETLLNQLRHIYGLEQAKTMVRIIAQPLVKNMNYNSVNLIVDFSQRLIQPNITLNKSETEERKRLASENISPVMHRIKAGEMIIREGERVSGLQLKKLEKLNSQGHAEKQYAKSFGTLIMLFCLLIITYFLLVTRNGIYRHLDNKKLLFISTILVGYMVFPKVSLILHESLNANAAVSISSSSLFFGIPTASAAMIICLFMGLYMAVPMALVVSICTAALLHFNFELFIYFFLNSIMAAYWIRDCRERKIFITTGVKLGVLNIILAAAIDLYRGNYTDFSVLWDFTFAFLGGIGAGVITAGVVPILEMVFDYTTDISLMELANLEKPLLRRLMLEAPGTYHHSVVVGSMVEAAAAEIGANPLLGRVCGYYHDIGKLKKPLYYVENQMDGVNRHDKLAPSMSSLILISHVKHGVEIAKENKLGNVIIDTIRQHHGTSLIKYFYEKARKLKGDAVKIEDFRYPGPIPQTKEAALVMLADVVEASSRTLANPTPSRIQGHVQKIINGIFIDAQLDNCELTLKDLHKIAKSFNKILNGIHHHRVEYPESGQSQEAKEKKEKNERSDQQPAKLQKDSPQKDSESGEGSIKRLGVSKG